MEDINKQEEEKKKTSIARRGLDKAGATPQSLMRDKMQADKKQRIKKQKDKMIRDKQSEIKDEKERLIEQEGDDGVVGDNLGNYGIGGNEGNQESKFGVNNGGQGNTLKDNEKISKLEDDIGGLEEQKKDVDKETFGDKVTDAYRTTMKLIRAGRRGIMAAGIGVKLIPLVLILILGSMATVIFVSSMTSAFILPAGAYAVLMDEEDGSEMRTTKEEEVKGVNTGSEGGGEVTEAEVVDGSAWPAPKTKKISSEFNPTRKHPITGKISPHNGTDIAGDSINGTDAVAYQDGKVVRSQFNDGGYGHYVVIQHGTNVQTYYAHLQKKGAEVGKDVKVGEKVGIIGTSGGSTGPHLHFEVRIKEGEGEFIPKDARGYLGEFLD